MGRKPGLPVVYERAGTSLLWCRFRVNGRRYFEPTGASDPDEAQKAAQKLYAEVCLGRQPPARRKVSFSTATSLEILAAEFCAWARTNKAGSYARSIEKHFRRFTKWWKRLPDITPEAVEEYKSHRLNSDGITSVTLHKELVSLSQFLKWCHRVKKVISEVPHFDRVKPVSDYVPPNLSRDDIDEVLAELPDRHRHPKRYPVKEYFTYEWSEAARQGETGKLRWPDVNLARREIFVRQTNDKAREAGGRHIAMDEAAAAVLSDLAAEDHDPQGLVFGQHDYRVSLKKAVERVNANRRERGLAELPHITPHHFRHARLSELCSETRDTAAVQALAGHKSLRTTDKYVRSRVERQAAVFASATAARQSMPVAARRRIPRQSGARRFRPPAQVNS